MPHDVIMPQMGESIAEGTVTTWLKEVGDTVERDEPLFEISTDKVDAEIPAPTSGVLLEIKVKPGETVSINTVVAVIGEEGEQPSDSDGDESAEARGGDAEGKKKDSDESEAKDDEKSEGKDEKKSEAKDDEKSEAKDEKKSEAKDEKKSEAKGDKKSEAKDEKKSEAKGDKESEARDDGPISLDERRRTKSSPVVRKIAAEHDIDIASIEGSGVGGRVTKQDILAVVDGGGQAAAVARQPSQGQAPAQAPGLPATIPEAYRPRVFEGDRVEELSNMRSKISEHMVLSKHISAHVGTVWEVDFSKVAELRKKHKAAWAERHGVNLTYTGFIMKATLDALKAFPMLNASLDDNRVIYHRDINLGLAVALDWGLLVPVVHQAGELNLLGLQRRAVDLAERARTKKLMPNEVQNGTFTITNPGVYGPMFGLPVINQPQVAILGVGAVEKRPVVIDDMIAIRTRAYLSLSFDHRLIDGAVADQFMARIKQGIEEFDDGEL